MPHPKDPTPADQHSVKPPPAPKGMQKNVRIAHLHECKRIGRPLVMMTAYDACFGAMADKSGADMILVGDTLGMVVHGFDTTLPVTMDMMVLHTQAVTRAAKRALVVADMPFMSYMVSVEEAVRNAGRLVKEGGAAAVKLEGRSEKILNTVAAIVEVGIPVMGHVGLVPQSVHALSGYRVQGREEKAAERLVNLAKGQEKAGAFAMVLECVPRALARRIASELTIPVIGIGAGDGVDGQVLVMHDMLGFTENPPRFVKKYANLGNATVRAFRKYGRDVREKLFPEDEHGFD